MYYEVTTFQEIVEIMASCDRLGLLYVIQKDIQEVDKWFGKKSTAIIYKLQVVQYADKEVEENEEETENLQGRPSESECFSTEEGGNDEN